MHMYMPWWKFDRKNDFPRGYHIEFNGGYEMPGVGMFDGLCREEEGYGTKLKQRARQYYGTTIGFAGRGEMLPNPDTYCESIPTSSTSGEFPCCASISNGRNTNCVRPKTCRIHFAALWRLWEASTKRKLPLMASTPSELRRRENHSRSRHRAHGADAKTSVLNGYCQAHDVKNLFVADGASLVTNPDKNPTLTIMALSWRASDYLLDEAKKGNL